MTADRAAALAGYLQALSRYRMERSEPPPAEEDELVYNYNRLQACRFGLDGALVHPKTCEVISIPITWNVRARGQRCKRSQARIRSREFGRMVDAAIARFRERH